MGPLLLLAVLAGPPADLELRARLEAESAGGANLHAKLAAVDPAAATRLHPNDLRRVVRALEVWELTGRPISDWQRQWKQAANDCGPAVYCVDRPREALYARIDRRVPEMLAGGWLDEDYRIWDSTGRLVAQSRQLARLPR